MNHYVFSGKILPERAIVNIPPIEINMEATDAGISGTVIVSIVVSQVSIVFNTNSESDIFTLRNYVESTLRTLVDTYGYLSGRGYDVEITSALNDKGGYTVFGVGIGELENAQNERPLSFQQLLTVMNKSTHYHRALGDLRESIRSPHDTGFFCYRAVECIRQHFKENNDGANDKMSWIRLKESLLIDITWIKKIQQFADPVRHGDTLYISEKNRLLVMQHAWKVVDRFCVYVYNNFEPISEDEFSLLKYDEII